MDFERVNMDELSEEELLKYARQGELIFKLNHTMPMTPEYDEILKELFGDNLNTDFCQSRYRTLPCVCPLCRMPR